MVEAYIKGKRISLNPSKSIGKGCEADVYNIGSGQALKIFKSPNHPDYNGLAIEQDGARKRIAEHQKKLLLFPKNLPDRVISPLELATNKTGKKIVGYTMKYLNNVEALFRYSDIGFRQAGIGNDYIVKIFLDLYKTVLSLHAKGVVIGDFNDLNVLVKKAEAYIIDTDSFQFGRFFCRMFTARFVDPRLCNPKEKNLMLYKPYNQESDWYAFAVMLMQSLLFVDPYGGLYRPNNKARQVPHNRRPLHRITVFNPEVRYPKPATPYKVLPDEMLHYFVEVFEKDKRGVFPENLIKNLQWTRCSTCGREHARNICPDCAQVSPIAIKEIIRVRGKVKASIIFKTKGLILFAAYQGNNFYYFYHENDQFKRENKTVVINGSLDPQIRYRLQGKATLMGKNGQVAIIKPDRPVERIVVDSYGSLPIFDANKDYHYWLHQGQLLKSGQFGQEFIGDVLAGQTLFWVGLNFGFGFYRAGNISVAFVFDAKRQGINDSVKLLPIRGQLIDSTCVFANDRCWFFISTQESGKTINQCLVIKQDGTIEATAKADSGDGSWLGSLRGKCAAGNFLLAATDGGIIRVEPVGERIDVTKEFPDTAKFVDSGCHLFPGNEGLFVVSSKEINLLKIN